MQLAASISPDPGIPCSAEAVLREQLATVDWDGVSLLLWHAPLPEGDAAAKIEAFVRRGGQVIFLPPKSSGGYSWERKQIAKRFGRGRCVG